MRDVAAHVLASSEVSPVGAIVAMVRARGNFHRMMRDDARRRSARPTGEIVADFRRLDGSRRHPPGTSPVEPLNDALVHTQDIAVPLGVRVSMNVEAARLAADRVWARGFPFHAQRTLAGVRLSATDTDWSVGEGLVVEGPIGQLLLLLTGRRVALAQLSGDGAGWLAQT